MNRYLRKSIIMLDGKEYGIIKIEVNWEKKKIWIFSERGNLIRSIEN